MKNIVLGDLIEPARVLRAGDGNYPILSMTMRDGLVDQAAKFKKRVASDNVSEYKVVGLGQLVVGFPIDEGVLDFQQLYPKAIVSPAYGIWNLSSRFDVDRSYLKRFLRSPQAMAYYKAKLRGSTARRRSLPTGVFLALPVPLPSLDEQRRIAAILDQADGLRAKRRQVLAHLDSLTQSIFCQMFGDPTSNGLATPRARIDSVADVMTGNSPPRADSSNFGRSIEWIKSDNLGGHVATVAEEWLSDKGRAVCRVAPVGSVLVTCIAGSPNSIGKASIVDREVAFNQQINAVLPSKRLDALFLLEQLRTAPALVREKSTGGMKGLVSKSSFQSIEILLPPLELQRKFAAHIEQVNARRAAVQRALAADDELFASLQSRAFRGEL